MMEHSHLHYIMPAGGLSFDRSHWVHTQKSKDFFIHRGGIFREMKLDLDEFIRRFLLHILPKGFFKVRYYGIYTNSGRKVNIAKAKELLSE